VNSYAVGDVLTYSDADYEAVYVYGLFDPVAPESIRYVGQTRFPLQRVINHAQWKSTCGPNVLSWFEMMRAEGRTPSMVILAITERIDKNGNSAEERNWMRKLIADGHPILNKGYQATLRPSLLREAANV
jgi:hypothetical protein